MPVLLLLWIIVLSFSLEGSQQFSLLAQSFLYGQLNFRQWIGGLGQDPVLYHGKIYWDEGPLPAILITPFMAVFEAFHYFFWQGYLTWLLILGVAFFVFRLARKIGFSKEDSLFLMFGFCLGSVFIGVSSVSSSWFFAQVLTTLLLFAGLYEYFRGSRRWWLLGIICGLLLMTRGTAAVLLLFFLLELWRGKVVIKGHKLKKLAELCLPVIAAGAFLGLYNFLRFHNPLNGGYMYQLLYPSAIASRDYGLFSLAHIPAGLYSALLRAPTPVLVNSGSWTLKFPFIKNNIYGMSIFITSPYLLALFFNKWSSFDRRARHLLLTAVVCALFVFAFFGLGMIQLGSRYTLDFLPELFVLFMLVYFKNHRRLSTGMKFTLIASGVLNFYLLMSLLL